MSLAANTASPRELQLIAAFAFLAGGFFFALAGVASAKVKRMRQWPTAEGKVTRSEVVLTRTWPNRMAVYEFRVEYAYAVAGTRRVGTRVSPSEAYTSFRETADALCRKYPTGSGVAVRYNPRKPGEAYLETDDGGGGVAMTLLVGAVCWTVCIVTGLLSLA